MKNAPISPALESKIGEISKTLLEQAGAEAFRRKSAPVKEVLKLVGAGAFLAASLATPNLPLALKPLLDFKRQRERESWKRFNLPYLQRTLRRLERQKLVEFAEEKDARVIKITNAGRRKILKYALDKIKIEKPKEWDGLWRLVGYDIPLKLKSRLEIFRDYLLAWRFYPLQESLFLHAYPCEKEIEFLREYLEIAKFVRIFRVSDLENDAPFRQFFGV